MSGPAFVSFLSDFGLGDEFVGVCHGVILRRCPAARIIDVTHAIPPQDVRTGALVLRAAVPYLPAAVHLAVVDPGVGAAGEDARRSIALRTVEQDRLFVGPDNGLLAPAAGVLGGVAEAVDIGASPARLEPVSRTFHGRDLFAPVAGALAAGEPLAELGEPMPADGVRGLELPAAQARDGSLVAHVLRRDTFGNLILDASAAVLASATGARPGDEVRVHRAGSAGAPHDAAYAGTFAEVAPGRLLLYVDAEGALALAVNRGSAAAVLGAGPDDELRLEPA
jgi:S-adenosyl-L-methionine hydrolase (adenosine-forming)